MTLWRILILIGVGVGLYGGVLWVVKWVKALW